MRRIGVLGGVFLLLAGSEAAALLRVGEVKRLKNLLMIRRADDIQWKRCLGVGETKILYDGDVAVTGKDSQAEILIDDGTRLIMLERTFLVLKVDRKSRKIRIEMKRGGIRTIGLPGAFTSQLVTPSGTVEGGASVFLNRVKSDSDLFVKVESGQPVNIVHKAGVIVVLTNGQEVDLKNFENKEVRITTPSTNQGKIEVKLTPTSTLNVVPGHEVQVKNNLAPGKGGSFEVQSLSGNKQDLTLTVKGQETAIKPGTQLTLEFGSDVDVDIEIDDAGVKLSTVSLPQQQPKPPETKKEAISSSADLTPAFPPKVVEQPPASPTQ